MVKCFAIAACALSLMAARTLPAFCQTAAPEVMLTVDAGRPLDIVLDKRVVIKDVGQSVTGVLMQPLYAYDRIVVPAGTKVQGRVAAIEPLPKTVRVRALLAGDLTPPRHVVLRFTALVLPSGATVPIDSAVKGEVPHAVRAATPQPKPDASRAKGVGRLEREASDRARAAISDARQRGNDLLAQFHQPGKGVRLKDALVQRLPYHPQVIDTGTAYHAELVEPLAFGTVTPTAPAPADAAPPPSSVLNARLITPLDSAKTPRGTHVQAVVTEPVFSADHQLIVPEGTIIDGEVTLAKPARRLHRNGQLRFLFETMRRGSAQAPFLASLRSVEASGDDHLTIDEEGGTTLASPKTRFIAPALAVLALRANLDDHDHLDPDGDGHVIRSGHPGALGAGGFLGLGLLGTALSQVSRPVGVTLSVVGVARTMYRNVLGRGREVTFAADTPMQLQLAPGPTAGR